METYATNIKFSVTKITILVSILYLMLFASYVMAAQINPIDEDPLGTANSIDYPALPEWWGAEGSGLLGLIKSDTKEKRNRSIIKLIKDKEFDQADKYIASSLEKTPDDSQLYNFKALLNVLRGDKDAAEQSYKQAIKLDPNNQLAYFGLAKLAIESEKLNIAKNYADNILNVNDKVASGYLLLSEIVNRQGDKQEAEQVLLTGYKKVQGSFNEEMRMINALINYYVDQKQIGKILSLSQEFVSRYPDNKDALSILAVAQVNNKQKFEAEQTLHKIIQQDKSDVQHRMLLVSVIYDEPARKQEILKLLDEAYEVSPSDIQPLIFKASYLIKLKQYQEALDIANRIDQLSPGSTVGKQLAGKIYIEEKNFEKAFEAFQQAYQKKPDNKVLLVMADILTEQGKQNEATDLLEHELKGGGNKITINFKLATIYEQQKDYQRAEKYYKAMLAEQPDNPLALNNLAWLYLQQNNPEAIKLSEQAYNNAPNSAAAADTYGYILIKQGEVEKGLGVLEKVVKAVPENREVLIHLAEGYSLQGNKSKAISILEPLVQENQSFSEKENAKQLLMKLKAE